jgi:hypothetical protein
VRRGVIQSSVYSLMLTTCSKYGVEHSLCTDYTHLFPLGQCWICRDEHSRQLRAQFSTQSFHLKYGGQLTRTTVPTTGRNELSKHDHPIRGAALYTTVDKTKNFSCDSQTLFLPDVMHANYAYKGPTISGGVIVRQSTYSQSHTSLQA